MKITWVTRSFLDYRIPVYSEINRLCGGRLSVIYYNKVVPISCQQKLESMIGSRALGISGEVRFGGKKVDNQSYANTGGIRIPVRPGLLKMLRNTEPDVVITDGFFQWTYAALLANLIWNTPHVMCYERTLHTERNVTKLRTFFRQRALQFINAICCNGIQTKEYLIELGVPEDRLFLGNMAADYRGLQSSIKECDSSETIWFKSQIRAQGIIFLYVGQLIPRKGVMKLLKAWAEFSVELMQEATLILLGGGSQEADVKEYISKQKLQNVIVPGPVDYSEIAKYYAIANVFIIATLEDNWSLVVPEAMAGGLPIISSKYNGCWPELVKPENGWVFDPLDEEDFSRTLKTAWVNRDNWKRMGQESLRIVQDYTPEKVAGNIYEACMKVTGAAAKKVL